jgi:uncharacterized protein with PQ loop repeat
MSNCIISGNNLSNLFGLLSSIIWFFVLIPQFYTNYKNNNSEAISLSLILLWIIGDIFSMISAYIKQISMVIIYLAIYHIIIGVLFSIHILFYRYKSKNRYTELQPLQQEQLILYFNEKILLGISLIFIVICFMLLSNFSIDFIIADIIGWVSTFIFIFSRIPQIYLNYTRKSVDGLNIYSLILVNIANIFFLTSILVNLCDTQDYNFFILNNLQWILGSTVTILFDLIIFYQFKKYNTIFLYLV